MQSHEYCLSVPKVIRSESPETRAHINDNVVDGIIMAGRSGQAGLRCIMIKSIELSFTTDVRQYHQS